MKIEYLEYILEIANQKSISKAAASLHIAQPALSSILNNMESELGFPVFHRHSRGVTPTLRGQKVIDEAPDMLNTYYNWKAASSITPAEINETVTIAAFWLCCSFFMPKLSMQLQQRYPGLQLDTQELSFQSVLNKIRLSDNDFSIALLAATPANATYMKNILKNCITPWESVPLYQDSTSLFVGENNPYFNYETIEAKDFSNLSLVEYYSPNRTLNSESLNFKRVTKAGSTEQILSMVANSDWVAFLPSSILTIHPYTQTHRLKGFSPKILENYYHTHYLIHKPANRLSYAERIILKEIKDTYSLSQI